MALSFEQGAALGGSLGQLGGYVGDKMGWTASSQAKARNDKLFGVAPTPTWGDQIASGAARLRDLAFNTNTGEAFTGSNSGGLSTATSAPPAYPAGTPAAKPAGFDDAFAPGNAFREAPGGAARTPASLSPTVPATAPAGSAAAATAPAAAAPVDTGAFGANIATADLIAVLRDQDSSDEDKKIAASILGPRMNPQDSTAILPEGGTLIDKRTGKVIAQGDPKMNDMQRNYELSRKDPAYAQFLKDQKAAGVNVNVGKEETAYQKKEGEINAETFNEMQKDSRSATSVLNSFEAMKALTKDPKFFSGTGQGFKLALDKAVVALGGDPKLTMAREVFASKAKQLVLDSLGGKLGAGVSNSDVAFIETISPNLDQTPEGIALLIEIQSRAAQRQKELAKLAVDYRREHGGKFDYGFMEVADAYAKAHPLYADLAAKIPAAAGAVESDGFSATPG